MNKTRKTIFYACFFVLFFRYFTGSLLQLVFFLLFFPLSNATSPQKLFHCLWQLVSCVQEIIKNDFLTFFFVQRWICFQGLERRNFYAFRWHWLPIWNSMLTKQSNKKGACHKLPFLCYQFIYSICLIPSNASLWRFEYFNVNLNAKQKEFINFHDYWSNIYVALWLPEKHS